ncbi:MAG: Sir2 family NAD-dependent protein deacetylase [Actinobacteria bacterium]|nr:Sir2 family NAD-dependent protein deacetylase [Actinomycetota bacterium]
MTVDALADLLADATRVVAFTGAGISTESGIPDFRSPGGVWTRYDPRDFTFDRYVDSAEVRRNSWAMRREFFAAAPEPNAAHRALAELEREGRLTAVITQNIDGLHQAAGSRNVIEVHGTAREVMCIGDHPRAGIAEGCDFRAPTTWAFERIDAGDDDPRCPRCDGLVKSATVSFGQAMFPEPLEVAAQHATTAELLLTIGSSLQVYPAAGIPEAAKRAGAALAILNDEATPFDRIADVVVRGRAGEVLPTAVATALGR